MEINHLLEMATVIDLTLTDSEEDCIDLTKESDEYEFLNTNARPSTIVQALHLGTMVLMIHSLLSGEEKNCK